MARLCLLAALCLASTHAFAPSDAARRPARSTALSSDSFVNKEFEQTIKEELEGDVRAARRLSLSWDWARGGGQAGTKNDWARCDVRLF